VVPVEKALEEPTPAIPQPLIPEERPSTTSKPKQSLAANVKAATVANTRLEREKEIVAKLGVYVPESNLRKFKPLQHLVPLQPQTDDRISSQLERIRSHQEIDAERRRAREEAVAATQRLMEAEVRATKRATYIDYRELFDPAVPSSGEDLASALQRSLGSVYWHHAHHAERAKARLAAYKASNNSSKRRADELAALQSLLSHLDKTVAYWDTISQKEMEMATDYERTAHDSRRLTAHVRYNARDDPDMEAFRGAEIALGEPFRQVRNFANEILSHASKLAPSESPLQGHKFERILNVATHHAVTMRSIATDATHPDKGVVSAIQLSLLHKAPLSQQKWILAMHQLRQFGQTKIGLHQWYKDAKQWAVKVEREHPTYQITLPLERASELISGHSDVTDLLPAYRKMAWHQAKTEDEQGLLQPYAAVFREEIDERLESVRRLARMTRRERVRQSVNFDARSDAWRASNLRTVSSSKLPATRVRSASAREPRSARPAPVAGLSFTPEIAS
ncbi:hypothetical protein LTS18_011507, partial [Coniosporium uncinatum]